MLRIIYKIFISILLFFTFPCNFVQGSKLKAPLKQLFSHGKHANMFKKLDLHCYECHDFTVKSKAPGPLGRPVNERFLDVPKHACHRCHFSKNSPPRPQYCGTCHQQAFQLKPSNHLLDWDKRHGKFAQVQGMLCTKCHSPQTCDQCHARLDLVNPHVHPANYRYAHSVKARSDPQSCVVCHKRASFCQDCHFGERK
ncbi:MAG: hypothetical protein HYS98_04090 [Deltaproteobacteria bacterium]|nr:hypothetical protein [Deltaproteobacteria bacterium]